MTTDAVPNRTATNRFGLPDLGFGLGLRTSHYHHITTHWPKVDWFEIISENFLDTGGRPLHFLDEVRERYPVVMHGVSLNIGTTDPPDGTFLSKLKALADRIKTPWMGDHVCFTGVNGKNGHDLYPLPYHDASLAHLIERVRHVQDVLERPLVLENPSTYVTFASSTIHEADFIATLARETGCALLLDVNNVHVTSTNHDLDPQDYLARLPLEHVVQIHIAGHTDRETHCIDTHDDFLIDPVWALYETVQRKAGPIATLLEWDAHIPDFSVVYAELQKARGYRERALSSVPR